MYRPDETSTSTTPAGEGRPEVVESVTEVPEQMYEKANLTPESDRNEQPPPTSYNYKKGPLEEVGFRCLSAGEILERQQAERLSYLPFLGREGVIVKGWSHILAAYPKVGKTELITRLIASWGREKVLLFSEEGEAICAERIRSSSSTLDHVRFALDLALAPKQVAAVIVEERPGVVVIDTVRNFAGIRDENDNAEVGRRLKPIIAVCRRYGCTLILSHHDRKGGGSHGEGIGGAHAFLGAVDVGIELRRGGAENRRTVEVTGRLIGSLSLAYEMDSEGDFVITGSPGDYTLAEVRKRCLEFLSKRSGERLTTEEVRSGIGGHVSPEQVRKALSSLFKAGEINRQPQEEKAGATYRWGV